MSINLRLCISFALLSFVSSPVLAEKFNNVIDDFDSYQQLERNNRIETVPTKTQPYDDLFRDLPFEPAPKKRAAVRKKAVKTKAVTTKTVRETSTGTKTVEPVKPEQVVEKIQYINVPTYYLTSAPSLFKPGQWTPHYLYRDYDKYTIVYNPLNLFTYLPPASIISHSTKLNIEQLTNIVRIAEQHRLSSIFNLGTAQAVGQLVMYQNLLGNAEFVAEITAKNRTVNDLNDQLSLKLAEIGKINASLTRANQRVVSLEKQLSEKADSVSSDKFDDLTKKLAAAINESSAKQEQIIKLAKDNEQIQQQIARTETQFADNLKIQNDLKLQLAEKEKLVQLAVQQLKDARGEFDQLKQTVETQRQMASKTNNEQVMALTANLKEQQAALKQKEAELANMQKDNDGIRQQLARNTEQSLSAAGRSALKINELERDVAAKKQLMDGQAVLKKELENALSKQKTLETQLAQRATSATDSEQKLKTAQGELVKLQQDIDKQRQVMAQASDKQVVALTTSLKEQQGILKQKESELTKTQKDIDALRQQLARNTEQNLSVVNKNTLKINELERDVAGKKQLMDSQAALKKELENALSKQKTLETQLAQRATSATDTEQKLKTAQGDLVKLQQDIDKQRQVMAQASDKQVVALTTSLKEQQGILKQKESELAKTQKDIDGLRQQLARNTEQNLSVVNKNALKINELERDVAAKKQLMDSQVALKKELENALSKQKMLETQLAQRATSATDTEQKLKTAQGELVKLQQDIDKQRQVMAQASDKQVVALTTSLKEQQGILKQKEAELAKTQKDIDTVRQQLTKNTELSQSVANKVAQQLKDKELQISQLEAAAKRQLADNESELKKQLQGALVAQKMLETQLTQRTGTATEAEKQLKAAQAEVAKLQQDIDKQRQTIAQANDKQVTVLTASLQEQQSALKKKEAELAKTLKSNDDFRQQLAQNTLNNLQAVQKYTAQVNEKQKLISQLEKDIAAKDKTVGKQSELEKQLQDAQAAQKALGTQLVEREKLASVADKQLKAAQGELAKLQQDIDKQSKVMSQTNDKKVVLLTANLKEQQDALKKKEAELTKTQKENDVIRQQLTENARQNDLVSRQIKEKEQQILQLESSIASKNSTVGKQSELEKQLKISQAAQKTLEAQLSQRDKATSDADQQLKTTQAQLAKLQQDIDKQRQVMSQTSDKQVTVLSASLKEQQTALQQKEAELAKVRKDNEAVRLQLAQNSEQNKQVALKIKEKEQLVELLEREIESKNKSTVKQSELEKRLADAKDNINKLTAESNKLRDVNAKFVAQSATIELLKQQLNAKVSGNDISSKELMIAKQDIDRLKTELDKQKTLSGSGVLNSKLDSQLEEANRKLAQLQKENDKLKTMSAAAPSGSTASSPATTAANRGTKPVVNSAKAAEDNKKKNKQIIADITKQKYNKLDVNTYYKILQKGKPVKSITNKNVSFMMREQLTDGTVTVMYTEANPVVLPYKELPAPLNTFIEKAGIGGVIKVYIKPEGGYGVDGIPGQIAPNSMSIIDLKLIKAE